MDVTLVIPVHNQLPFTRQCLEGLNTHGCPDTAIIVVDNGSTDGTAEFLAARPGLRVITNSENRACAAAWNQGFAASRTRWTLFLNNDILATSGWLENLVNFAEKSGTAIACPALGEGELDYDLGGHAQRFTTVMRDVARPSFGHGCAFLVDREVFARLGGFDENFRWGGNEDEDFFWRARDAGFQIATTGASYLHHFGSVTQTALKSARGSTRAESVGYFREKWKLGWLRRRWLRLQRKLRDARWVRTELRHHGLTLLTTHAHGKIIPR